MSSAQDIVTSASAKRPADFKQHFENIIVQRVHDALAGKRDQVLGIADSSDTQD